MPNWTRIVETGHNEGRAYNALGTNLTETPIGPKNRMVGSYDLDFRYTTSGGFIWDAVDTVASTATFGGELTSNEFSVIIADGREMMPDLADEDTDTDNVDIDEATAGGQAVEYDGVVISGRPCTLTGVRATMLFAPATHYSANIYQAGVLDDGLDMTEGETNAVIVAEHDMGMGLGSKFSAWLDLQVQSPFELDQQVDNWSRYAQDYRYSLNWALYVIKLSPPPGGDKQSDDIQQAADADGTDTASQELLGTSTSTHTWVPTEGPAGLLTVMGLDTISASGNAYEWPEGNWRRLWDKEPGGNYLKRGRMILPYKVEPNLAAYGIEWYDGSWIDIELDGNPMSGTGERDGVSVEMRGALIKLNVTWTGEHHLAADEMVVLHIQTGRAALAGPSNSPLLGQAQPALVIGGPTTIQPVMGPTFSLVHWRVLGRSRTT